MQRDLDSDSYSCQCEWGLTLSNPGASPASDDDDNDIGGDWQGTGDYELVLVGHSLGAGVAAILAVLLRREHPTLHCYAYSPPGCLMRYHSTSSRQWFIKHTVK